MKVGLRDASWYNRPNTSEVKRMHAVTNQLMAMCSRRILIDEHSLDDSEQVPRSLLCLRCFPADA